MSNVLTFHSSLLIGDLIYALPGIRQVCRTYNRKAIIYLGLNLAWPMPKEISRNGGITMTDQDFKMIKPLLMSQWYIEDVRPHNGEKVAVNFDDIFTYKINVPYGYLPRWYFYIWPDMACDLSVPWITDIYNGDGDTIILNRSARYHNPSISYKFLEQYKSKILFIGHDDEWKSFCKTQFEVRHYKVKDFLDLAILINSCRFFIGNQSFCFSLAEGLKKPRILELFEQLPNVIPHGEYAYDYYSQGAFEGYVDKLVKMTE